MKAYKADHTDVSRLELMILRTIDVNTNEKQPHPTRYPIMIACAGQSSAPIPAYYPDSEVVETLEDLIDQGIVIADDTGDYTRYHLPEDVDERIGTSL